jgi:transcriptional regulator with XRE-family HTH domain
VEFDRIKLRELRRSKKINGITFAKAIHVGNGYLSAIEGGARTPSARLVERMAKALHVAPGELWLAPPPAKEESPDDPIIRLIVESLPALRPSQHAEVLALVKRMCEQDALEGGRGQAGKVGKPGK